jgi:small subunit ribosomal protein S21
MGSVSFLANKLLNNIRGRQLYLQIRVIFSADAERTKSQGVSMPLRMRVHEREPIGLALRRFKKLLERSGIQKELRKRKYYEKPCEARRRAELRKQSAIRKAKLGPKKP